MLVADGWSKDRRPLGVWIVGRNVNAEVERRFIGEATDLGGFRFITADGASGARPLSGPWGYKRLQDT